MKAATQQNVHRQSVAGGSINSVNAMAKFFNAFDYKGEYCSSCGHPWMETGELHYKSCRYYVPNRLHNHKKH